MNEIIKLITALEESAVNGEADAIESLFEINQIVNRATEAKKAIQVEALAEADNYAEKTFEHNMFKVERRAGRKIFNFKNIEEHANKKKELSDLEARYKAAYSSYEKGVVAIDEETGEQIPIPAVTNTADVLIIKPKS